MLSKAPAEAAEDESVPQDSLIFLLKLDFPGPVILTGRHKLRLLRKLVVFSSLLHFQIHRCSRSFLIPSGNRLTEGLLVLLCATFTEADL